MEDASLKQIQELQAYMDESPGEIVSRIRERLRAAIAYEAAGDNQLARDQRDRAETLIRRLEQNVAPTIAVMAGKYFRPDQADYGDVVIEMVDTLRRCVTDLSPTHAAFESRFQTCFWKKCMTAIRTVSRENGLIGQNAPPNGALLSLQSPVGDGSSETKPELGDTLRDTRMGTAERAHEWCMSDPAFEGLMDALEELPTRLKEVCKLFYQEFTYEQIGKQLGISSKTASTRHAEAYRCVRERLNG